MNLKRQRLESSTTIHNQYTLPGIMRYLHKLCAFKDQVSQEKKCIFCTALNCITLLYMIIDIQELPMDTLASLSPLP